MSAASPPTAAAAAAAGRHSVGVSPIASPFNPPLGTKISPGPAATQTFTLQLEDFAALPAVVGSRLQGARFDVGGHGWRLAVYPGGKGNKDHVGVFLLYCGSRDGVEAEFTFTATHSGHPSYLKRQTTQTLFARQKDAAQDWHQGRGYSTLCKRSDISGPGHLTIVVNVTVFSGKLEITSLQTATPTTVAVPPPSLGASLHQLLESGTLSDVQLKTADGQTTVDAHKAILASQSPVFAAMFGSGMVESSGREISLEGISGPTLRLLLRFIYTDELANQGQLTSCELEGLLAAADQYQCPRLLALCEQRLCGMVNIESSAGLLVLSEQHRAAQLKEHCLDFISQQPAQVMTTEGWQQLGTHPNLLQELFAHKAGVRKRPRDAAGEEGANKQGGGLTREQVRGMKVPELRAACVKAELDSSGLKGALVARLEAWLD